jgi:hypothetical protein
MFNYWSAPPSLLRAWACPEEPSAAVDGRFRFGSSVRAALDKDDSRLGRFGCYVRALFFSRTADPQMPAC